MMKTICACLALLCTLQLNAQFTPLAEDKISQNINNFNIQLNHTGLVNFNYERLLVEKGKYSLSGLLGLSARLPFISRHGFRRNYLNMPAGFSADLGIVNRWQFNEKHSIQVGAGITRFQLYNPQHYKYYFEDRSSNRISKYLEINYRYQPKNSNLYLTAGYRHNFNPVGGPTGGFRFGVGYRF